MSIAGRLPKVASNPALDDPFLVSPNGDTTMTLGDLIRYGLDQPDDYPHGYCGPTDRSDVRFLACERGHRARERARCALRALKGAPTAN